jgi:hypothetical protein
MRKPFWTVERKRTLGAGITFVVTYVLVSVPTRLVLDLEPGWASFVPYIIAAVCGVAAQFGYRAWDRKRMVRWVTRQARAHGGSVLQARQMLGGMWTPFFEIARKTPSMLIAFSEVNSRFDILPKDTPIVQLLTRKAKALTEAHVWDSLAPEQRVLLTEAVLSYPDEDDPAELRSVFEAVDASTAISFLATAKNSSMALVAVRSGVPLEYVQAAR